MTNARVTLTTKQDIEGEYYQQCMDLVRQVPSLSRYNNREIRLSKQGGGLFNYLLKLETPQGDYYFKKYLDDVETPLFSPPKSMAIDRATLAYEVQQKARQLMGADIVPEILAFSPSHNAFLMAGMQNVAPCIDKLSTGSIPDLVTTRFAGSLAKMHLEPLQEYSKESLFYNTEFRDFKLKLQYENIAKNIGGETGRLITEIGSSYKNRRECMCHGDINSRNILLSQSDGNAIMVIDFEQSHIGTPSFDVAYILCELYTSALNFGGARPDFSPLLKFIDNYFDAFGDIQRRQMEEEITLHTAVQTIYRILGPSRNSWTFYVKPEDKDHIITEACRMIEERPTPISQVLSR